MPEQFKLSFRDRLRVRKIAQEAFLASDDPAEAKEAAEAKIRSEFASMVLVAIAIRLAFALIEYWWNNRTEDSLAGGFQQGEPGYGLQVDEPTLGRSPNSQFPRRWQPIRGAYNRSPYARRGRFGPREFGETMSFAAMIQPAILLLSTWIEQQAAAHDPTINGYATFGAAYGSSLGIALGGKLLVGFLRNFGASILEDFGAWLWSHVVNALWQYVASTFFFWWPFRGRDCHESDDRRRRPVRDWWRNR